MKQLRLPGVFCCVVLVVAACGAQADLADSYIIKDLGTLGGDTYGTALNDGGVVVGHSKDGSGNVMAFVWEAGTGMTPLGTLGGNLSAARGINNSGQIVGYSRTGSDDQSLRAFLYQSGSMADLGTHPEKISQAYAINDNGQIVGQYYPGSTSNSRPLGFFYDSGTAHEIGTIGGDYSVAHAVNSNGMTTGQSMYPDYTCGAYRYELGTGLEDLEAPYWGKGINDSGQIVGRTASGTGRPRAALYDPSTTAWTDLGTLDNGDTEAYDINNNGTVVGYSEVGGNPHAFGWDSTNAMVYLGDLLADPTGWDYLYNATAINEKGQIVGAGVVRGEYRAFLMTPVPAAVEGVLAGSDVDVAYDPAGMQNGGYGTGGMDEGLGPPRSLPGTSGLDTAQVDNAIAALGGVDPYLTLKMYYEDADIAGLGIMEHTLRPYWWDDVPEVGAAPQWYLGGTTTGGAKGTGEFAGINVDESSYGLGYCGLNTVDNYVWTNINHASDYTVAGQTPVPGSVLLALIGLGIVPLARRKLSKAETPGDQPQTER